MRTLRVLATIAFVSLFILCACGPRESPPETSAPPPPADSTPSSGETRPMPDAVQIVNIDPPLANGLSADDPLTLKIAYTLNEAQGTLQVWFERFQDADCAVLGWDAGGNSTLPGGTLMTVNGGAAEISVPLPPIPPVDTQYIGVGARLWTLDTSATLAEDMRYEWCYQARAAVEPPPTPMPAVSGNAGAASGLVIATEPPAGPVAPAGPGAPGPASPLTIPLQIAGFVLEDQNANGITDIGEVFLVDLAVRLATGDCLTTLSVTRTDGNGFYAFRDLAAGEYCIILVYSSGGIVIPGTSIRATLSQSDPGMTANFCVQPPPPPPPVPAPVYGAIGGTVTRDGIGQVGVTVNLTEAGSPLLVSVTTDATGAFIFPNLPEGTQYSIEAYDNAYGMNVSIGPITVMAGLLDVEYIVFNP